MSTLDNINTNLCHLVKGWDESIDYRVKIWLHHEWCANREPGVVVECECPTVFENRAKTINHDGYLTQLRNFAEEGDSGPASTAERMPPNKPGSRPPGRMQGFNLLDEITSEAYSLADRVMAEIGMDATYVLVDLNNLLARLAIEARKREETIPTITRDIRDAFRKWVRDARKVLSYDLPEQMLADTVCGECGGGLAASTGSVRCAGTPASAPCGTVYDKHTWVSLLQEVPDE